MTTGQKEKHIAAVFSFGHRTTIGPAVTTTYLPLTGGTNQGTEISFIVPQDGILKNLFWDCASNTLNNATNKFTIQKGAAHVSPAIAPPLTNILAVMVNGKTNESIPAWTLPVFAGERIAILVQTAAGSAGTNILRLRVSFELEVDKVSETWQLAADNTTVFYDGGNVGIGTATPSETLSVNGIIESRNGGFKFPDGTVQTTTAPGGSSVISEFGGNVGIGIDPTRTPQEKLTLSPNSNLAIEMPTPNVVNIVHVYNGILDPGTYYIRVAASDGIGWTKASDEIAFTLTSEYKGMSIMWTRVPGSNKYKLYIAMSPGGPYKSVETNLQSGPSLYDGYNYESNSPYFNPDTPQSETTAFVNKLSAAGPSWLLGGNLRIGMANPITTLEVNGTTRIGGNNFAPGIYVDSMGKVGIGTSNPAAPLHIKPGVVYLDGAPGARVYFNNNGPEWCIGTENGAGGGIFSLYNYRLNRLAFTLNPNDNGAGFDGIVYAPCYFYTSSKRWKKNILPIKDALSTVKRLRGVSYDQKENDKHTIGLVAEEVGEVLPEIVSYEENGKDAKGLDYSRLVALLIEAVKEQQVQIEELKAKVKSS